MRHEKSLQLYKEAERYMPGGVNSPVRAFIAVEHPPVFIDHASKGHIVDVDGNEYIDFVCSWGPLLLGHSERCIVEGIEDAACKGMSYGFSTALEVEMAKLIVEAYPAIDKIRMVSSGTEATMSALRVARGYTGRKKIVKFEGCYHGHSDGLLVGAGSGAFTFGIPTSLGVSEEVVKDTIVAKYNDIKHIEEIFKEQGSSIAAVIVEPIAGNMGLIEGKKQFLQVIRDLCMQYKCVLVFDEVITGFRIAYGSAPEYLGITPDMVCFGKIIGGGMPVGAYGGKKEIMDMVSPVGKVYQAGTLSGNPLAMYIGKKQLEILKGHPEIYIDIEKKAKYLADGFKDNLKKLGLPFVVHQSASLMCLFFTSGELESFDDVKKCDTKLFSAYYKQMIERGILLPPAQFECMFLSYAHTEEDIERTISANYEALKNIIV